MKIIVFGGTTEGSELAYRLAELGFDVTVSVATEYGSDVQRRHENLTVLTGRLDVDEMKSLIEEYELCIDATHPYAKNVTQNIRQAADCLPARYIRFLRPEGDTDGAICVADAESAAGWIKEHTGNVLLATGAKELVKYKDAGVERIYPRVLPMEESLKLCDAAGIPRKNIIAMQGPFIKEMNEALYKQYGIDIMVTKNSGRTGGYDEKLASCRESGVTMVVITRPADKGINSIDEIIKICLEERDG